ncbi:TPA: alpha-glucosidase/alpha-galactosidase, partial [Candidatus Bathyarchaeota archaeon]|nr:alpha-glucosidase/alpha-galactosidase [Candidatus Bathyarchaeota archaeon]
MTAVKISIIGAGSAAWSMTLIRDLCLTKGLWGSTVSLMDISKERLDMVYNLARRYAAEVKADLRFEKTMDRGETLRDADFVFNTALAGGHESYEIQRKVAEKHGYYRGIDSVDHNMVSDYYTVGGYNQLRLFLDVARDMEEICPDAWLIQTANPVFEGCTLLTRETEIKVVGLCHGHLGYEDVASVLGLDPRDVTFQAVGFNHCIWLTDFRYRGEDAYPLIDEWIEKRAEAFWRGWRPRYHETQMSPAAVDMYRRFGLFPIGDTTRSGGWKYHTDLETKKRWYGPLGGFDSEIGWAMYLDDLGKIMDRMFEVAADPSISLTKEFPPVKSEEAHVPIIDAIVNDREGIFQVNIPNDGAISGIPDDVVVEIPAVVSGR